MESGLSQSLSRDFASHDSHQSWADSGLRIEGVGDLEAQNSCADAKPSQKLRRKSLRKANKKSVDFMSQDLLSHDSLAADCANDSVVPTSVLSHDSLASDGSADPAGQQPIDGEPESPAQTSAVVEALWEMCEEDELRELAFAFTSCDIDNSNALEANELCAMLVMHSKSVTIDQVNELMRVGKARYVDWSKGQELSELDEDIMLNKMMVAAGMQLGATKHGGLRTFAELNIQERHKQLRGLATGAISFVEDATKQAAKLVEEQSKAAASMVEQKTGVMETTRKAANMVENQTGLMQNTLKAAQFVDAKTGATDTAKRAANSIQEGAKGLDETARKAARELEEQSKRAVSVAEDRANQAARLAGGTTKFAYGAIEGSAKQLTDTTKTMANKLEQRTGVLEMTKQGLGAVESRTGVVQKIGRAANVIDGATGVSEKAKLAAVLMEENTMFLADQLAAAKRAFQNDINDREEELQLSVNFAEYLFTVQSKEMQDLVQLDPHTLAQQMRVYRNAFDMVDVDGNNALEFDELEMVVLSLNPHLMLTDVDLLYLWGVLTGPAAAQHAETARIEMREEWEEEVKQELDELDQKVGALEREESKLQSRLRLRFSGELPPKEETWLRRRLGKIAQELEELKEPRQKVLEKLLNPDLFLNAQPEPEPEPGPDLELGMSQDSSGAGRKVVTGSQLLCQGLVRVQFAGKGEFIAVWMSIGSDGTLTFRDVTAMPSKFSGKSWQGQILRTASAVQSGLRPPRKRRRGIKSAIRIDLFKRDTCGDIKYIIYADPSKRENSLSIRDVRKTMTTFAVGRWEDSRAIMLDFNQFLHGMAAVQRDVKTSRWIDVFRPNRWELLSLIIDTPVSEGEEVRILEDLSPIERVGVGMLKRHWKEMDMANMRAVLTKAGSGQLRFLEEQQVERMNHLHNKAVLVSALLGLTFAAVAALVENVLAYELGLNGAKDAYWVCTLESRLDLDPNSTTAGQFIPTFPGLAHPDEMMCTTIHVNASSCINDFMQTASVIIPEDVQHGAGYFPPGTTAEDLKDVFGHHQNGLHGWTTLQTGSEKMEDICSSCECVVCGCATHAPLIGRVELGAENKQVLFWGILGPTLIVSMSMEIGLLLYCAMRYCTRVAWALDIRLTPLNTDRAFVANSLVRAAFELGNPDSPMLGVDPQQPDSDVSTVLMLMLFKLKTFLTGTLIKLFIGLVCSPETSLWLKPWLGMVLSAIVWDALTCHNLMVQARIRGFGVYVGVELFNEIIDESYSSRRGEVDSDSLSLLAKLQIARAVGVAIVIHGSMHPTMELLLRHSLQFLGLRGSRFVGETGVLDNREGFLRELTAGARAVFEQEHTDADDTNVIFEAESPRSDNQTISFVSPIVTECSEDETSPEPKPQDVGDQLKSMEHTKRSSMRRLNSSGLWSMVSGDESNDVIKLSREDQVAVLCVHLLAFVLDGYLDPKELELWKDVCETVGASLRFINVSACCTYP